MERKDFLKKGFGSLLGIAAINACKSTEIDPTTSTSTGTGTSTGTTTGSTNGNSSSSCTATPSETDGPYPTKSPSSYVRKDITDGKTGVAMVANLTIKNASSSCAALEGAIVDIWHCDAAGNYSEYGNYTTVHFLRGRQVTDANGLASYTSIFPGWYSGRAPHIHVHIYNAAGKSLLITQIAFPYGVTNLVYTTGQSYGYTKGAQDTLNERDGILSDSLTYELATLTGSLSGGYTLALTIVVNA